MILHENGLFWPKRIQPTKYQLFDIGEDDFSPKLLLKVVSLS